MPADFDSPVSIADEHTRAAMSDADRDKLAEAALDAATAAGLPRSRGLTQVAYAAVNGLRVLGAINVALADLGLELGALVRATALSGLATAHAASEDVPPELIADLGEIAADGDDEAGADAIGHAAAVLAELDDTGCHELADALRASDPLGREAYAELLDHHLNGPDDEGDDA